MVNTVCLLGVSEISHLHVPGSYLPRSGLRRRMYLNLKPIAILHLWQHIHSLDFDLALWFSRKKNGTMQSCPRTHDCRSVCTYSKWYSTTSSTIAHRTVSRNSRSRRDKVPSRCVTAALSRRVSSSRTVMASLACRRFMRRLSTKSPASRPRDCEEVDQVCGGRFVRGANIGYTHICIVYTTGRRYSVL